MFSVSKNQILLKNGCCKIAPAWQSDLDMTTAHTTRTSRCRTTLLYILYLYLLHTYEWQCFRSVCNLRQLCGSQSQSTKPGNICRVFRGPLDALLVMLLSPFSTDMHWAYINKYFVSFLYGSQIWPLNLSTYRFNRAPLWPRKVFGSWQIDISAFLPLPLANVRQWDHLVQILLTMINGFD